MVTVRVYLSRVFVFVLSKWVQRRTVLLVYDQMASDERIVLCVPDVFLHAGLQLLADHTDFPLRVRFTTFFFCF